MKRSSLLDRFISQSFLLISMAYPTCIMLILSTSVDTGSTISTSVDTGSTISTSVDTGSTISTSVDTGSTISTEC